MLRALHIRDFVIVTEAEINFNSGFTVFSGETGAGKSILIDALALAMGARSDSSVLRQGSARAEISAVFDTPETLIKWLTEHDLHAEDELILRRIIDAQGRSRAYINGSAVTITQLREVGEYLVDIHGQHAHQSLLRPESQRDLLDAHGGLQPLRQSVGQAWKAWRSVQRKLALTEQDASTLAAAREKLEWQLDQLDRLALSPGEWETLSNEHTRLANAQSLLDGAAQILNWLDEGDDSVHQRLSSSVHRANQLLKHDPHLQTVHDALESSSIAVSEAVSDLNAYLSSVELDPERLAQAEERMRQIFDCARQFKTEPEQLTALHETLRQEQANLQASTDVEALRKESARLEKDYLQHASTLTQARKKSAKDLAKLVTGAMQTLAMQGGQFDISIDAGNPSGQGVDAIEFLVAGHAGTTPKPLAKVASGGELARISLALSVIASRAARVPTLIFDEVDSGIGGAVAEVVGNLLRELGSRHQVLCVTHLPQVASRGMHHFRVSKTQDQQTTESRIAALNEQDRIEEIARMLGGLKITDTTRQHAQEMLRP
ncbi:DNA repair protein RecN [Orrella sp. NBD-18]|uniref:DNA repair protein RecN n=1 Tax=Sheuella amnicola TaxID=2707330 RepID=A0A6B2QXY5_9BURK|nr:DNA repair protein RecN [Sheuella amnicola]NDY82881.1 DNA repair protein RecN [Sheuella amnicola]HBI84031.1 DNA repair protein RecN [Alcaligenaceae bacterium]